MLIGQLLFCISTARRNFLFPYFLIVVKILVDGKEKIRKVGYACGAFQGSGLPYFVLPCRMDN